MKEIERIALKCYLSLEGTQEEHWYIEPNDIKKEFMGYAKAIEQYVIKARIEENEIYVLQTLNEGGKKTKINSFKAIERIAELKKGLNEIPKTN